ncbi:MAG: radical SAM protein [Methanomicrobia archaeon]|nr:radical SAM protein [Methanomicrobia archaeon]
MRVYLLNPPYLPHFGRGMRWQDTGRGGTLYYPIWLSYATALVEQAHETRLVDAPAWNWDREAVITDVNRFKPDLIVIDSSFPSLQNDIDIAGALKKITGSCIVLVGPPASQFPDEILDNNGIDIVARFEYDYTIKELADTVENGTKLAGVQGISYKENNGRIRHNPDRGFTASEDLDRIPFVSNVYKNHLNIEDYFLGSSLYPEVQIFTGRGCPYQCTFCSWPQTLMGRQYRVRSIPNVLDELAWIEDNLPEVKEVFFEDDTFTINRSLEKKNRVLAFCNEYKERGLNITWACNARVGLDYETMRAMKRAHCRLVIVGYESGSDEILKNIKKGITVEQIKRFAKDARAAGLLVHADFIIGLPGETKATIEETRTLIRETRPELLQVAVASPFPGTEFYTWCKANGYLTTDDPGGYLDEHGHQKAIVSYPLLSNEEITDAVDELLKQYYLSFRYVPLAVRQVLRRNGLAEARRLWHSAKMFMKYVRGRA